MSEASAVGHRGEKQCRYLMSWDAHETSSMSWYWPDGLQRGPKSKRGLSNGSNQTCYSSFSSFLAYFPYLPSPPWTLATRYITSFYSSYHVRNSTCPGYVMNVLGLSYPCVALTIPGVQDTVYQGWLVLIEQNMSRETRRSPFTVQCLLKWAPLSCLRLRISFNIDYGGGSVRQRRT